MPNKTAFITGASRGIGRGIALSLADGGLILPGMPEVPGMRWNGGKQCR